MVNVYILLVLYWIIYFIIHSMFASLWIKDLFKKNLPVLSRYYRLIYVIFSFLLLSGIFISGSHISPEYLFEKSDYSMILGLILTASGFIVFREGLKLYNLRAFLGLGYNKDQYGIIPPLKTDGLLKYSRHPLYASSIIIIIGYFLFNPTISILLSTITLILYFIIGIQFEERRLLREYGDTYSQYIKETPMLFPGIKYFLNHH
ncbi:methyltransferase family protein [Bacteroidota bacterium]